MSKWLYAGGGVIAGSAVAFPLGLYFGLRWGLKHVRAALGLPLVGLPPLSSTPDLMKAIEILRTKKTQTGPVTPKVSPKPLTGVAAKTLTPDDLFEEYTALPAGVEVTG